MLDSKTSNMERVVEIVGESEIEIKITGQRHLGEVIGSQEYKRLYNNNLVEEWAKMINRVSDFGQSQPQAAYAAFTHGVRHKMTYFMRTIEGIDQYLQPLDMLINEKFIPTLFGCPITPLERRTIALPVRYGGLGIPVYQSWHQRSIKHPWK